MAKKTKTPKRTPKGSPFTTTLYAHVRPESRAWVKRNAKTHGSESALVDWLISQARNVKPVKGLWLPK